MKYLKIVYFISFYFLITPIIRAESLSSDEIVRRTNDIINQASVKSVARMIITTTSGKKREFIYESYSKNRGEKNLIKYLAPKRVKGQTILMLNNADDIWAYFPRTGRVRKLATHAKKQKMEGSDFSYEDMGSGDAWVTDFDSKRLDDGKIEGTECFKLELTRRPDAESGYSRMIMWIEMEKFVPIRIDYYDDDDPEVHLKRLNFSDYRDIEGTPTSMKMAMLNIQDNSDTVMEFDEVTYKADLPDDIFTERGMKK